MVTRKGEKAKTMQPVGKIIQLHLSLSLCLCIQSINRSCVYRCCGVYFMLCFAEHPTLQLFLCTLTVCFFCTICIGCVKLQTVRCYVYHISTFLKIIWGKWCLMPSAHLQCCSVCTVCSLHTLHSLHSLQGTVDAVCIPDVKPVGEK